MNRRTLIQTMAGGAAVNLAGLLSQNPLRAQPSPQEAQARRGLPPLKITNVKGRCCMIQLRREWGRFSNFSFRAPQRRISAYPARPSG